MVIAAVEHLLPARERIVDDALAVRLLPAGLRLTVRACRWPAARRLLIAATDKQASGIWAGVLCRKRYADDQVRAALEAGIEQVVLLGAGLDTRSCRLVAPAGGCAFEVDLPENIADKRDRLQTVLGRVPENVVLIPADFETADLARLLAEHGYRADRPAMFVGEAVSQYLSPQAVHSMFGFLAGAAPGSRLVFTYVRQDFLDGTDLHGAQNAHRAFVTEQRVWRFGLAPEAVADLLAAYGWAEREQVGPQEYLTRYIRPAARALSPSPIERFVCADKR
jgi:methyltransferase (TIGR00027 family)